MCPPWLGCRVRVSGLVFLLSPVLSPNLSPILAGALRPLPWSRLSLVSGLVSQLVSGQECCVCLPSLVLLLSPNLSPIWAFQLISGLGCCVPPPWSCLALVSSFVSQCVFLSKSLVSSFSCLWSCLPTCLRSGMLRPPPWSCLALVSGLAMLLSVVWDAVSASLVLSCSWFCKCHGISQILRAY